MTILRETENAKGEKYKKGTGNKFNDMKWNIEVDLRIVAI